MMETEIDNVTFGQIIEKAFNDLKTEDPTLFTGEDISSHVETKTTTAYGARCKNKGKHRCEPCNMSFPGMSQLRKHLTTTLAHAGLPSDVIRDKIYGCALCNYQTAGRQTYTTHLKSTKHLKAITNSQLQSRGFVPPTADAMDYSLVDAL